MFALLLIIPLVTGCLAVGIFRWSFYGIKHNQYGVQPKESHLNYFPILGSLTGKDQKGGASTPMTEKFFSLTHGGKSHSGDIIGWPEDPNKRRKVLIATLEYEIIDWKLKVK